MSMSKQQNIAVVLYGKNDLRLEQRPIPKPRNNEALLQMGCVGICGSDVHFLLNGRIGSLVVENPMIVGHEASGTVVEIGSDVKHLKPGDRVAIESGISCMNCNLCREGNYHVCEVGTFCGCPPSNGNLSQYYCHSADFLFKLPDHVSMEEGTLLEPFTVAVHACKRGGVTANSTVLILGTGPIGLCMVLAAHAFGATKIIVTDLLASRVQLAIKLGANFGIKIDPGDNEADTVKKILDICEAPSITFDCSGTESCIRIGMLVTKRCGVVVLVGFGNPEMKLPLLEAQLKEVDIRTSLKYCNDYPTALGLVASGKVNLKPLITHRYKIEDSIEAFEAFQSGDAIKIMIHPNSNEKI